MVFVVAALVGISSLAFSIVQILLPLDSLKEAWNLQDGKEGLSLRAAQRQNCPPCPASEVAPGGKNCGSPALNLETFQHSSQHAALHLRMSEELYQANRRRRDRAYGPDPMKWIERKQREFPNRMGSAYLLEYFAPLYPCIPEERLGRWRDEGKWVCRVGSLNASSVVYSIGSNSQDTFERELFSRTRAQIHVFDHTLSADEQVKLRRRREYRFHAKGIAVASNASANIMSLQAMMEMLHHTYTDVFKIDCEGCEYEVLTSILNNTHAAPFGQVLVEVHKVPHRAVLAPFLQMMEARGYRLFHAEMVWLTMNALELAYIHESLC